MAQNEKKSVITLPQKQPLPLGLIDKKHVA